MFSIKNLTISVDQKIVVHDLSLALPANTIHILMGPNGSGKSSLAYALMGHPTYSVIQGIACIAETNILEMPVEERARAGLFLACQYPQEVPGVLVATFLKEAYRMLVSPDCTSKEFQEKLYAVLDIVHLDHSFAYRYLHEGFSGGEKKRLEIVQMLLLKPKVVILDEIDSGLDRDGIVLVADAIKHLRNISPSTSFIIITHYQKIIDFINPDTVHVIINGKLIASGDGNLAELINQKGYDALSI